MKRRIIMFKKLSHDVIQGVQSAGKNLVYVGMPCTADTMHGGGFVSEMELSGGNMILIRKRDAEGKPWRNYGALSVSPQGGAITPFIADGVLFPASETRGILFEDVEDAKEKAVQAQASPPQKGGKP